MTIDLNNNINNLCKFIDEYYSIKKSNDEMISNEEKIISEKIKKYDNWNNDVKSKIYIMNKHFTVESILNVVNCIENGYLYREVYDTLNLISLESLKSSDKINLKNKSIFLYRVIVIIKNKKKEEIEEILNSYKSKIFIKNYKNWLNRFNKLDYINYII